VTDAQGRFEYRVFQGAYDVTVDPGFGEPVQTTIDVAPGDRPAVLMVPLVPGSCFPAGEVQDLRLGHDRDGSVTTLTWEPPRLRNDMAVRYDTLRSEAPADFGAGADCLESGDGSDAAAESRLSERAR
jgi:hypothetical protein